MLMELMHFEFNVTVMKNKIDNFTGWKTVILIIRVHAEISMYGCICWR
jgi:hypothetical protein